MEPVDPGRDWLTTRGNLQPVGYTAVRRQGNLTAPRVMATVEPLVIQENQPSRGVAVEFEILVTCRRCDLPGTPPAPKPWDQIVWRGGTYTVQRVRPTPSLTLAVLECQDQALARDLADRGNLLRPQDTQDPTGKRVSSYATVAESVPCRVQPVGGESDPGRFDARTERGRWRAFLGLIVYPQAGDVFQVGQRRWTVTGYGEPETISTLPYLDLLDEDQGVA